MIKPANYDSTEVREYGDFKALPLGGHQMVISKAYEGETTTFRPTLTLELDVAAGEHKWYFSEMYQNDNQPNKKWPRGGVYSVIIDNDEKTLPFFKGLITSIENSNSGFKFNFDDASVKALSGKLVGAIYGLEEYENDKGEVKTARKIRYTRSIDKVQNVPIPDVKLINGTYMSYDDYEECLENKKVNTSNSNSVNSNQEKEEFIKNKLDI